MELLPLLGLIFTLLFFGLVTYYLTLGRRRLNQGFREIAAFTRLKRAVGLAVEAGARLQVSLGWGPPTGTEFAPGLAGLTVLDRVARAASASDRPPLATSGEGTLAILSQDTSRAGYRAMGAENQFEPNLGRLTGVTPFSYAAGVMPLFQDEGISAQISVGHFTDEIALINDAAERRGSLTIAGTDNLPAQAVIYATSQEPLIGEEVFAGGAYLGSGISHQASLQTQDILRLLVVILLIAGAVVRLLGLDTFLVNIFAGFLS